MLAEIGDKVPTAGKLWAVAAFLSVAGFVLCRWSRVAAIIVLPFAALWGTAVILELRDPYIGPAILEELGLGYVVQAYVTVFVPFMALVIGCWKFKLETAK
jgi:hypothetical protein